MKNEAAAQLGKSGGLKKSEKKTKACRKNASKPRARWVTAIYYEIEYSNQLGRRGTRDGLLLQKGKTNCNLVDNQEEIIKMIEADVGGKIGALRKFQSVSKKI
jgi:hypothetical protein